MKAPYIANEQKEEPRSALPDWREILTIIMERFWFGLLAAIVVFLVMYFKLSQMTPYYRSTAVLMVEPMLPKVLNYQDIVASNLRSLEYFNTVIKALHSQQMMENALLHSGLAESKAFLPHLTNVSDKASAALSYISINPVEKTRWIQIRAEHPDPVIASDLANAMANSYIQQELENRMTASMQAVEWLQEKSLEYQEKLEKGMLALQEYRENAESVSLEEDQNIVIAKLKSLNSSLTSAQAERIGVETKWQRVKARLEKLMQGDPDTHWERLQGIAPEMDNPQLNESLSRLRQQRQEISRLRERYKSEHPALKEATQQEELLLEDFKEAFNASVLAIRNQYETLLAREKNLKKALRDQEQVSFQLARQLVEYNDLKRNVEADQGIYESIIARMKEASLSETLPSDVIRLAEEARPAKSPFRPNRSRILLRAGVLALAAGFGVIFLLYYTDRRFRRYEEIERSLGIPVLTALPVIRGKTVRDRGMVAYDQPDGEVAEAFRTLRAIMEINPDTEAAKVLLVTSAHPAEGKSFVSVNIAMSHAQDNRKTLLLGADLRRPVLSKYFTVSHRHPGLSNVLSGEMEWKSALISDIIPNLDLLACGAHKEKPTELLGSPRFREIMREVSDQYDRVIIDAPPVLGISDTLVLLKQAESVLFVVRYGVTHNIGASHAMKRIKASGTPCIGAVMNGVDLRSMANSYYYRYYGGYTYQQYTQQGQAKAGDGALPDHKSKPRSWLSFRKTKSDEDV